MSKNNPDDVDLSAPGPQDVPEVPDPQGQPPAPNPDDNYLRREKWDDLERRGMRYVLFAVVIVFACFFLGWGLHFALEVGDGLLYAKKSIADAITGQNPAKCLVPLRCVAEGAQTIAAEQPLSAASTAHLNTDWLSASSLIAIVAVILGVGLTLILTLLKAAYQHPTDKTAKADDKTTIELATPLSQLILSAVNYLKDRLSK